MAEVCAHIAITIMVSFILVCDIIKYIYISFSRFVVLIVDEMKVREDLIYDKTGETVHGFTNLGDVNNQLRELEKQANSGKPYDSFVTQIPTLIGPRSLH